MAASPTLPGDVLDYYLSIGYYRMQQEVFTCRFLPHAGQLYAVHWLRLVLARVTHGPKQRQLLRRNACFNVVVQPFEIRPEYAELYARYYESLGFDASPTLEALLLDETGATVFNTYAVEVRDGVRLVAVGVFDAGQDSIMGIVNFYDPAYHKHSLGKYLMLLKTECARQQQKTYYYPGYLVYGYPKFDYKLFACQAATEVFDCLKDEWAVFEWEGVAARSAQLLDDYNAKIT